MTVYDKFLLNSFEENVDQIISAFSTLHFCVSNIWQNTTRINIALATNNSKNKRIKKIEIKLAFD